MCPNGYSNKEEFIKLYQQLYPHKKCENFMHEIFQLFDMDKNGIITFSEFLIAISLSGHRKPEEKLRLVFKMYDYNQNGLIEKEEIDTILKSVAHISPEIDEQAIINWDKDNNGHLNEEEFVQFIMNNPKLRKYFIELIKIHDS